MHVSVRFHLSRAQSTSALAAFTTSVQRLLAVNLDNSSTFWSGLNQFSGSSLATLTADVLIKNPRQRNTTAPTNASSYGSGSGGRRRQVITAPLPQYVNWTATGRTTPVRPNEYD